MHLVGRQIHNLTHWKVLRSTLTRILIIHLSLIIRIRLIKERAGELTPCLRLPARLLSVVGKWLFMLEVSVIHTIRLPTARMML